MIEQSVLPYSLAPQDLYTLYFASGPIPNHSRHPFQAIPGPIPCAAHPSIPPFLQTSPGSSSSCPYQIHQHETPSKVPHLLGSTTLRPLQAPVLLEPIRLQFPKTSLLLDPVTSRLPEATHSLDSTNSRSHYL